MHWLDPDRPPVIMGILNVTPDSFSDGGRHCEIDAAVAHARCMLQEGADIIDVGGESTRPGAERLDAGIQTDRVVPVIRALREHLGPEPAISIDTSLSAVAHAALDAGADMVNDVSAGRDSPDMLELVVARNVPIVLMHMRGQPATMQRAPWYGDVVTEVCSFLNARAEAALRAGAVPGHVLVDPGIGFGKRAQHNLRLLRALEQVVALGHPVLLGVSRKRFMGRLCDEREPTELLGAGCAATALAVAAGVRVLRVHDVKANRQAADVAWALRPSAS